MSSFFIVSTTKKSKGEPMGHGAEHLDNLVFYTRLIKQILYYL